MEFDGIWEIVLQYGIFAALFVALLVYTIKQNEKRENDYRAVIKSLNETLDTTTNKICGDVGNILGGLHIVSKDVDEIKHNVEGIKKDVKIISSNLPRRTTDGGYFNE